MEEVLSLLIINVAALLSVCSRLWEEAEMRPARLGWLQKG